MLKALRTMAVAAITAAAALGLVVGLVSPPEPAVARLAGVQGDVSASK